MHFRNKVSNDKSKQTLHRAFARKHFCKKVKFIHINYIQYIFTSVNNMQTYTIQWIHYVNITFPVNYSL